MGIGCSCSSRLSRVQSQSLDAVKQKSPTVLVTTVDPSFPMEQMRLELKSYLEENKGCMNKSILRMYKAAVESPELGLSTLKLKLCRMREIDWTHFSKLLSYPRLVSQVLLWKLSLTTKGFEQFCGYLPALCTLRHLALRDIGLGYHAVQRLAATLCELTTLTHLSLTMNCLRSEHLEVLLPCIGFLSNLTDFSLDENEIDDLGCPALCSLLPSLPVLTLLSLRFNSVTYRGCALLLKASNPRPNLKILLEGNEIVEADWSRLLAPSNLP